MAIQMRRGKFTNFLPSKLQPGEWAIVQGEDPSATDGCSVYVAFAAGVVKRMATYTDMVDNCRDAIEQSIGDIKAKLTAKVEATNATVEDAESKRVAAEASRVSAESSRVDAEQGRVEAESSRVSAESSRESAEEKRVADQLKNNADQAQNNAAAKGLTYKVCGTGEYSLDAVDGAHNVPTVIGRDGTMYLTPKVDGATDEDKYDQWMYIDSKWELMGESGAHIDPTTTGDVDTIVSGTNVTADRYRNSTGLSYFWVKAVDKLNGLFAAKAHSHTVGDVTGTVAIENGGTGATTAADALTNLGAASQTDVDALRDSVSQIPKAPKLFVGTRIVNKWTSDGQLEIFNAIKFKSLFGRAFDSGKDAVLAMNADYQSRPEYFSTAAYYGADGSLWVKSWSGSGSGNTRINYLVALGE